MANQICITGLYYYPVKSCHGIPLQQAVVEARGLQDDRRWMVIGPDGCFLTQRELPRMALIHPEITKERLVFRAPGMEDLALPLNRKDSCILSVQVWHDWCRGRDWGEEAAGWLSGFLGRECRLVSMSEGFIRPVNPRYGQPGDQVGFADGFPLLLASENSLEELNRRLPEPVPMARFRANVVIGGAEPFAEDDWEAITVRGVTLRVVKPCARCVITTIDQEKGVKTGTEPLETLSTFRLWEEVGKPQGVMFGQNLIHNWTGKLFKMEVGDEVVVERMR